MPENPTNSVQAFIANPLFGLVLALLLTFLSLVASYSELDINIINRSDRDYVDLDICLKPDLLVAKIGCREHSGNAEVSFEPANST